MKFTLAASLLATAAAFAPAPVDRPSFALDMARKPFISGNWKLNPQTKDEATKLAADIAAAVTDKSPDSDVALFVPYVFIDAAKAAVGDKLQIGAQVSRSSDDFSTK